MQENSQAKLKTGLKKKIALIIFGLFLFFVLLEIGLRLGGFILLSIQEHNNLRSIKQKGAYRILCLGESTTMDGYPAYLEKDLNGRKTGIVFSVINKGISGTDTSVIVSELENNLNKYSPDLVITMMGINDRGVYMPRPQAPASKSRLFLRSFRTYKLAKLLALHIAKKAEVAGFIKPAINKPTIPQGEGKEQEAGLIPRDTGKINPGENEKYWMKRVDKNPRNARVCLEAGKFYAYRGKILEAKELLKRAIELEPRQVDAYYMLAWLYQDGLQYLESEKIYKEIILINSDSIPAYWGLADAYLFSGKFAESEEALKKALKLAPENAETYFKLGSLYLKQKKFLQAQEVLREGLAVNPGHERACGALVALYEEMGRDSSAEEYRKKLEDLAVAKFNSVSKDNYLRLKAVLDKHGKKLVCVQYPLRSIGPLKDIFREVKEGIIFVDNQASFKKAVEEEGYAEYFLDNFAGDFGHCTPKGNELLAENIAKAVLKEIFNK